MEGITNVISKEQQLAYAKLERDGAKAYVNGYNDYLKKYIGTDEILILDIGGGAGYFANEIKAFYNQNNTNASVNVIDNCQYNEWLLFDNVNFIAESAFTALDKFPDSSVDICFLNMILHHLTTDTYKKTRKSQQELLEMIYKKIKPDGYVCITECYNQNPIIRGFSTPVAYLLSSIELPILKKIAKKIGVGVTGAAVCFLSNESWEKLFSKIGFKIIDNQESPWHWEIKLLLRNKPFTFILSKNNLEKDSL